MLDATSLKASDFPEALQLIKRPIPYCVKLEAGYASMYKLTNSLTPEQAPAFKLPESLFKRSFLGLENINPGLSGLFIKRPSHCHALKMQGAFCVSVKTDNGWSKEYGEPGDYLISSSQQVNRVCKSENLAIEFTTSLEQFSKNIRPSVQKLEPQIRTAQVVRLL